MAGGGPTAPPAAWPLQPSPPRFPAPEAPRSPALSAACLSVICETGFHQPGDDRALGRCREQDKVSMAACVNTQVRKGEPPADTDAAAGTGLQGSRHPERVLLGWARLVPRLRPRGLSDHTFSSSIPRLSLVLRPGPWTRTGENAGSASCRRTASAAGEQQQQLPRGCSGDEGWARAGGTQGIMTILSPGACIQTPCPS